MASIYESTIRHRVSPEVIGSRNCVPIQYERRIKEAPGIKFRYTEFKKRCYVEASVGGVAKSITAGPFDRHVLRTSYQHFTTVDSYFSIIRGAPVDLNFVSDKRHR